MPGKSLVVDANILIRAVLGQRVRRILESHAGNISLFIPETAYAEAEEHLAALVVKSGGDPTKAVRLLHSMTALGTVVSRDLYFLGRRGSPVHSADEDKSKSVNSSKTAA